MTTPYRHEAAPTAPAHAIVRCHFYIRTRADGGWRYTSVHTGLNATSESHLATTHPPAVGDQITLYDPITKAGGVYRVLERAWSHAEYGSADWPYLQAMPQAGPSLEIIVEPARGLFRDEAPEPEEPS